MQAGKIRNKPAWFLKDRLCSFYTKPAKTQQPTL